MNIFYQNEKVIICEIIYERNFENNFIVFFHIIDFYNF